MHAHALSKVGGNKKAARSSLKTLRNMEMHEWQKSKPWLQKNTRKRQTRRPLVSRDREEEERKRNRSRNELHGKVLQASVHPFSFHAWLSCLANCTSFLRQIFTLRHSPCSPFSSGALLRLCRSREREVWDCEVL